MTEELLEPNAAFKKLLSEGETPTRVIADNSGSQHLGINQFQDLIKEGDIEFIIYSSKGELSPLVLRLDNDQVHMYEFKTQKYVQVSFETFMKILSSTQGIFVQNRLLRMMKDIEWVGAEPKVIDLDAFLLEAGWGE